MASTGLIWKIYQADGGNHEHRPIYGANVLEPWLLYRITSSPALFFNDTEKRIDFYNYQTEFTRYRAISLQPGGLTDSYDALDHSKMKIIILNLRDKTVEKKIVITRPGCGDGKYDSSLGTEFCDDGNTANGDGCD